MRVGAVALQPTGPWLQGTGSSLPWASPAPGTPAGCSPVPSRAEHPGKSSEKAVAPPLSEWRQPM